MEINAIVAVSCALGLILLMAGIIWALWIWKQKTDANIESFRSGSMSSPRTQPSSGPGPSSFRDTRPAKLMAQQSESPDTSPKKKPEKESKDEVTPESAYNQEELKKLKDERKEAESAAKRMFIIFSIATALLSQLWLKATPEETLLFLPPVLLVFLDRPLAYHLLVISIFVALGQFIELLSLKLLDKNFDDLGYFYWILVIAIPITMFNLKGITPGSNGSAVFLGHVLWFKLNAGIFWESFIARVIQFPVTVQALRIYKKEDPNDLGLGILTRVGDEIPPENEDDKKAEGTTLAYVRAAAEWFVSDIVQATRFANIKPDEKVDWDKTQKAKFDDQLVSYVKSYLRPLLNGTLFDNLITDETKRDVNLPQRLNILNAMLEVKFGIRITQILLEKATPNEKLGKLLEAGLFEDLQRIAEEKDANTQARLFLIMINKVLGYTPKDGEPQKMWKDLTPLEQETVRSLVLQAQGKLNPGDAAIADAVRTFFGGNMVSKLRGKKGQGNGGGINNSGDKNPKKGKKKHVDDDDDEEDEEGKIE